MAIDGIKIIDSDLAHDVYNEVMDLYDSGVEIEEVKKKVEKLRDELDDDVELELFITSFALALWETGNLTESILYDVRQTIENGATVKMWREENCEREGVLREKELDKFLTKISIPKEKPRKRKKYKKISRFIFRIDDVLTFQATAGNYYAAVLISIDQYRGHCYYRFTPTQYCKKEKPSIRDIENGSVLGRKIGSTFDKEMIKHQQPGIETFWETDKQFKMNFIIGLDTIGVEHKELSKFYDKFEVIGNIIIKDGFREFASISYADNFEDFSSRFLNLNQKQKAFNLEGIPLKMISK